MAGPRIAIVYYSMFGHIRQMALAEKRGIEKAGGTVDVYQIAETLSDEVLEKMHALPKDTTHPVLESPDVLRDYDAFLFGIPTRYGNMPAQWKTFWDRTGGVWASGGYWGKKAGMFTSTGTLGGGQESTFISCMSTFVHHGISFVPLGYGPVFKHLSRLDEVHGGSAWGAGCFSLPDGSRLASDLELEIAELQGKTFYERLIKG